MTTYPKISVITPNYNQAGFIEETIASVLSQNYSNLEYIIIDGGSTDRSLDIIKKYQDQLAYWVSEKDGGMYDAINKGFQRSSGEIMCWINSDDILQAGALLEVAKLFENHREVKWLQGKPTVIDEQGETLKHPKPVGSKQHFYLGFYKKEYSFIQQESTFWKRELWEQAGGAISTDYSLAADFDLWMRFFKHGEMFLTDRPLGAFRVRPGQKSANQGGYLKEANLALAAHIRSLPAKERLDIFINKSRVQFWSYWKFTYCNKRLKQLKRQLVVNKTLPK